MKDTIKERVVAAARQAFQDGLLNSDDIPEIEMETPRHESHGDISTNWAMISAAVQKMAPRKIAEAIVPLIDGTDIIERIEIAGPGFINFFLFDRTWHAVIHQVFRKDEAYGASDYGRGQKVQVEFVSANPTGPLHIGHGRGAAVGDSIGNILAFSGFDVQKEYYINDSGRQIATLGRSVWLRLRELSGEKIDFPDDCYQGDYIKALAEELHEKYGEAIFSKSGAEALDICAAYSADKILEGIKADLEAFGVTFDRWFSEQSLYDRGLVEETIAGFRSKGTVYEKDGAMWFRTSDYGDEKDRVVVRSNGETTYFASDIAYHMEKFDRGFDRVIDVWGADHHGYIKRIKASITAQDRDSDQFDVMLVQLVTLLRSGVPCAMSTRAGEFVTLRDIVDEVGRDAARFLFLSRSYEANLDFDLEIAKQQNADNPVYYVQYVHARISSILLKATNEGRIPEKEIALTEDAARAIETVKEKEEIHILKLLWLFPEHVEKSAGTLHPHVIFTCLMELASAFHAYYNKHKVITEDKELTLGRLCLVSAVKKVIRNGLHLLGVSAPERM